MRLLNWEAQAALNAMPGIRPGEIHTPPWHEFWRRFRRQPVAMGAGIFVLLLIAVAIVAPWIAPYDAENYFDYDRLNEGPSLVHWFWSRLPGTGYFQPGAGRGADLAGRRGTGGADWRGHRHGAWAAGWLL